MKVLHVPYCFYPDSVGGTEVYVYELARELRALGFESVVAAPGEQARQYTHDGFEVHRYAVPTRVADVASLHGEGWPEAAAGFAAVLDRVQPTTAHFHSFTAGASVRNLRECQLRGIPAVFTYHTPTATCPRGTLLRWGKEVCDGRLDRSRCSCCVLHSRGASRPLAAVLGRLPVAVSRRLRLKPTGRAWTALGLPYLVDRRLTAVREFLDGFATIVVPCDWAFDVLRRNSVPVEKLFRSRQGLSWAGPAREPAPVDESAPVRLLFVGRADPTKGLAIVIAALRACPDLNARLTAIATAAGCDEAHLAALRTSARGDPRIRFRPPIWDRSALIAEMGRHDYLVAPSLWLETGPMVVLEAGAAGVPTIGSRLGGLAELIRDGVDGLLVPPGDVSAWQRCLERVVRDRILLRTLRRGIAPPRTMTVVAREMASLYGRIASDSSTSAGPEDRALW